MALDIVAWHDRITSDHQTQYLNARAAGYLDLTSISFVQSISQSDSFGSHF